MATARKQITMRLAVFTRWRGENRLGYLFIIKIIHENCSRGLIITLMSSSFHGLLKKFVRPACKNRTYTRRTTFNRSCLELEEPLLPPIPIKEHACYMRYNCNICNICNKCDKLSEPLLKEQKGSEKKRSRNAACATLLSRGQSKHPTVMHPPLLKRREGDNSPPLSGKGI